MEINHRKEENKGVFIATENDVKAGEMTYSKAGDDKFIIDHTEVNPEFKGKGVGKEMVFAAVEYARENNIKILPLCPFAKAMFDKNKDIQDVLV
ncbi:N-acetyltransferase [Flavobacterium sp. CBA20B-1]|uniref:GNAT family N-acetyltransferase n=1 Tax=unclassified Flavobacterium TaxID=196869 RepID=UPI0022244206|nr:MULTISPECIES: GNAT family N-acetyltransferase [unclassified Flavobacterium]WCM41633.1 N-acetyltransferase [Flavobacterium sp. CBA20B-1]